jgi:hypothetical protein
MLRWLGFGLLVVIVVVAVSLVSSSQRKEDEKRFQATLAEYQSAVKPGTNRAQVESYLQKQNISFERACCGPQAISDRAQLGELPRNLFCQPWKVYLDFQFKSSESPADVARDSDLLTSIDLNREGVCF